MKWQQGPDGVASPAWIAFLIVVFVLVAVLTW